MRLDALIGVAQGAGRRLVLGGVLPNVLLLVSLAALIRAGAPGQRPALSDVADQFRHAGIAQSLAVGVAATVAALLLTPLQLPLVRLLEGYWPDTGAIGRLKRRRCTAYAARCADDRALAAPRSAPPPADERALVDRAVWRLRHLYPQDAERTMPTRLGNVLRAAEDQAGGRYGLDTVTFWPRLYPLLPERLSTLADDARNQLDIAARFCAVFALGAVSTGILLARHGSWWLLLPVALVALSILAHRSALNAALLYGQALQIAFDLHRFDLRRALHLPLPPDLATERAWNTELSAFLAQGLDMAASYVHEPAPDTP
ncbi:hypothetical protein ACFQ7F_36805 [Streptomyces sp. NPDC056486]|uniref:hypothetical protein n=1 Tax=Streptomyces sp. NPDC056486 TaxID=3345835 RepID=UPI00369444AE